MDKLVTCKKCQGNACYEQVIDNVITTWLCMGCGFTTSTQLQEGSELHTSTMETSPELYRDLSVVDDTGKVWVPSTITLPGKGMVFIDGTDKKDWKWSAVKAIEITEEDRKLKNYPKDQQFRMDMVNAQKFEHKQFMDALEVIGFFEQDMV